MKKNGFWAVFWFIIKCTFIGFGGGNALMPVIKRYAVDKNQWITEEEFDKGVVASNMIPGPAVIEILSYVAIKVLGKTKGTIATLLAILPHVIIVMGMYYFLNLLPQQYLWVINVGVIPIIIGLLISFSWRYIKMANKELSLPLWLSLFILVIAFALFVPAPWNIVAIPMILTIVIVFIYEFFRQRKEKKKGDK